MSKNKDFLEILGMDEVSVEDWRQNRHRFAMDNPNACEIVEMAHKMAQSFEEELGYSRHDMCRGLFMASLQLAFRREDQRYIELPEDQRSFHLWALKQLKMEMDITTTPEQQSAYEKKEGKRPLWLFDSENFGAKDDEKARH